MVKEVEKKMEKYGHAPIIIPTLNRYTHLKRCVESLSKCIGANETVLIISVDFPPSEKYVEGFKKIKAYLPYITGFKDVVVLLADNNLGVRDNCKKLYEYVRKSGYRSYIFTEDDNEFSPNFLEYINKGLWEYADNEKVMAVCGYLHPTVKFNTGERFFGNIYTAWGVGMWIDKEFKTQKSESNNYLYMVLNSWHKSISLFFKRSNSLQGFLTMHFKNEYYGDVYKTAEVLMEGKWCVFPTITKVKNWGHDGSGVNCKIVKNDIYLKQEIDKRKFFFDDSISLPSYNSARCIDSPLWRRAIIFIRYIMYRFFNLDLLLFYYRTNKKLGRL